MAIAVCDNVVVAVGAVGARQADDPRRVLARPANIMRHFISHAAACVATPAAPKRTRWRLSSNPLPGRSV